MFEPMWVSNRTAALFHATVEKSVVDIPVILELQTG